MDLIVTQSELPRDTTEITVTNADDGEFIMVFLRPDNLEYINSEMIVSGASANNFRNSIKNIYQTVYGVAPSVTKICRDEDDIEMDCNDDTKSIKDHVYTLIIEKSISGPSTTMIQLAAIST